VYTKDHLNPILSNLNLVNLIYLWGIHFSLIHINIIFSHTTTIPKCSHSLNFFLKKWSTHFLFPPKHDNFIAHLIHLKLSSLIAVQDHRNSSPQQSLEYQCYVAIPDNHIHYEKNVNQSCMTCVNLNTETS
jgi:hypothetical protein